MTALRRRYRVTLQGDTLIAVASVVSRDGGPQTIEAFLQRAIAYGLRANLEDVEDRAVVVEEFDEWLSEEGAA